MIEYLINLIRGYVAFEISGFFPERFINLCINEKIYLWDIKKTEGKVLVKCSAAGFKRIRGAARKTKTRVKIIEKKGMPIFLKRYRKRKAFLAGMLIFAMLIFYLTSFVWSVEVEGNININKNIIINNLSSCGIHIGVVKYSVNLNEVKEKMLKKTPELKWLWVEINGTKATVKVREKTPVPEVTPRYPCNLVAEKDGVIKDFLVHDGEIAVLRGATVKKGDLLVSGVSEGAYGALHLYHASAEVSATVWYEKTKTFKREITEYNRTGRKESRYSIGYDNFSLKLWFGKAENYKNHETEYSKKQVALFGSFYLPISVYQTDYFETEKVTYKLSDSDTVKYYQNKIKSMVLKEIPSDAKIIKTDFSHAFSESKIKLKCVMECEEDICKEVKITYEE